MRGDPQWKSFASAVGEVKEAGIESGTLSLRAAHIGLPPDHDGDVLRAGATTPHWAVLAAWQHSGVTHGVPPAGKLYIREEGGHVVGDGLFFATQQGQEYRRMLQGLGGLAQFSVEYRVTGEDVLTATERAAGARRAIKSWDVLAVAPVLQGAMPQTGLTSIKCARCQAKQSVPDTEIRAMVEQHERREREFAASEAKRLEPLIADARRELGWLPEVKVNAERRELAEAIVAWTARQWVVRAPVVKWTSRSAITSLGCYYKGGGVAWLRSDLWAESAIADVAIHETCHHARHVRGLPNTEAEVYEDTACLLPRLYQENSRHVYYAA